MTDKIIRATGKVAELRFVLCDLTQSANIIGSKHGLKGQALALLGEICVASVFQSASLKHAGAVSTSFEFSGGYATFTAETTPLGLIRAKPAFTNPEVATLGGDIQKGLIRTKQMDGKGKLLKESIVEMESISVAKSICSYFLQSEQLKNAAGIESKIDPKDDSKLLFVGGYYAEALPKINEATLNMLELNISQLGGFDKFYSSDDSLNLVQLLDALMNPMPIEIHKEFEASHYCPCDQSRIMGGLATLDLKDLNEIAKDPSDLEIHCDFCRSHYVVTSQDLNDIIAQKA
jgi:molecular chaperone Hsp33